MKRSGAVSALAAVASAFTTIACCLPVGFLGAAGLAAVAATFQAGRPWLLALSGLLLLIGFVQVLREHRCRTRPNWFSVAMLAAALFLVLVVALFPQVVAGLLADFAG